MSLRTYVVMILLAPALAIAETPPPSSPDPSQPNPTMPEPPKVATPAADGSTPLAMKSLKLKLSGVLYASWGIDVAGANPDTSDRVAGNNRFDVTRAYFNIEPQITKNITLRITPDVTRIQGTEGNVDGSLAFRLKYAYAQFNEVAPGLALKAGMQHTAYIDFEDSLWKYRVLGPSAYEFFTRKASADLGVGAIGRHLDGLLEYQVVLSNGEGYTRAERSAAYPEGDGKYKEVGARVTLAPFARNDDALKGLKLTGFGQYGFTRSARIDGEREHLATSRVLGLASYEHPFFTVAAGYGVTGDDALSDDEVPALEEASGSLLTTFGYVNLPANLRVLGRFDSFDPNGDEDDDERTRVIGGLAYLFSDMVQVVGDWQHFGYANEDQEPDVVGDQFFVHLEAKY